ncbi:Uma2 family endonuclease [Sphingomonas sp. H39-1-10]|uniref:Uma2 family endonuclease n=1 Tax=Sphingomonas pollutisoli TaxID=3030829 RepID=UPI0023B88FBF|nr:Uma2 family endonuclease [Sphingomonas pollutisoli]MDF0489843.1 Uma2 family endonuclease [Sphingomonas pollutisoli]
MMAGGTARHVLVQGNILVALASRLRDSDCTPFTSIMAAQTHAYSVRYPDVTIYRSGSGREHDDARAFDDPVAIFEVMSAGTSRTNLIVKLEEHTALESVDTIVFVDIARERLRVIQRTGVGAWTDVAYREPVDLALPSVRTELTHAEIFAR